MKKFFLTFLAVLGFASQAGSKTQVTLDQIVAPTTTAIMVSVPGKGWTPAQLDPSLVLDTTTVPPTLRAVPGSPGPTFVDSVTPTGTVDGTNTVFTLPSIPNPAASLCLNVNGLTYRTGVDFNLSGATVTFLTPSTPPSGSVLVASYRK